MAANRNRRLVKEIQDVQKDSHSGVQLEPFNKSNTGSDGFDDLTHFKGVFTGPPDTPYHGGTFLVDISIPAEYPFQPPVMRFITKIWHPNVSSVTVSLTDLSRGSEPLLIYYPQGAICLDTLGSAWSPVLTLKSALISLQSLLSSPEPKDPQDAEVARMLITNPREFEHVAREWAIKHAGAPDPTPGSSGAEGSGGVTEEALRKKDEQKREKAEAAKLAAYVACLETRRRDLLLTPCAAAIVATTSNLWIASPLWASMCLPLLLRSTMWVLTGTRVKTMSWRRSTWATSQHACLASPEPLSPRFMILIFP